MWYRAPEVLTTQTRYHLSKRRMATWNYHGGIRKLEIRHGGGSPGIVGCIGQANPATAASRNEKAMGEHFGSEFVDLMTQFFIMLPEFRVTASDALKATWLVAAFGAQ